MMLAFIMYMTLRNAAQQKDMVEVGAQEGEAGPLDPHQGSMGRVQGHGREAACQSKVLALGVICPRVIHRPGQIKLASSCLIHPLCSPLACRYAHELVKEQEGKQRRETQRAHCLARKAFLVLCRWAAELIRPPNGAPGRRVIDPWGFVHHRWLILTFPPCLTRMRSHLLGSGAAARCAVGPSCWRPHLNTWKLSARTMGCCHPSTNPSKRTRCEHPHPHPISALTDCQQGASGRVVLMTKQEGFARGGCLPWPATHL